MREEEKAGTLNSARSGCSVLTESATLGSASYNALSAPSLLLRPISFLYIPSLCEDSTMSKPDIVPKTTASGIAVDPRTLERVIPESRRSDGTYVTVPRPLCYACV
jgi:hypothetical protein